MVYTIKKKQDTIIMKNSNKHDNSNNQKTATAFTDSTQISVEKGFTILYFVLFFVVTLSMILGQPFGEAPDEINRYRIPQYICEHGTLPNGYDESIRIPGYGFSYAFQPILPYMIQGYVMRFVSLFTGSAATLLFAARMVNLCFGMLMAYFVLATGKKVFSSPGIRWVFCFLVMFLPQSLFMHTYVNTDSMTMLSIAMILYALISAMQEGFTTKYSILLSVSIIFCGLSYYNAYGYILSSILLFIAFHIHYENGNFTFDNKNFWKRGLFIAALVLLGISWWFLRSYFLYDGDFLGLKSRDACALLYANPDLNPATRVTYQSQGYSMLHMLLHSDFVILVTNSFIAAFGPMNVLTNIWIYRFYKLFFLVGALLFVCLPAKKMSMHGNSKLADKSSYTTQSRPWLTIFFHANMVFCMVLPTLLNIYYSYTTDYQPQGRYSLPMLIPFAYYICRGYEKLVNKNAVTPKLKTALSGCLLFGITASILITIYGYVLPLYLS